MDGDNRTRAAAARTESEARRVLGRPRLTVVVDRDLPTNSSYETASSHSDAQESASPSESDLIFGRPETFGAAGGLSTSRMPNVKERAVAISAWKILEMKKERKNGHARAMEWSCLSSASGHGDYYWCQNKEPNKIELFAITEINDDPFLLEKAIEAKNSNYGLFVRCIKQ